MKEKKIWKRREKKISKSEEKKIIRKVKGKKEVEKRRKT